MASYAVAPLRDTLSTKVETNFKVSTALELHESFTGHRVQNAWFEYLIAERVFKVFTRNSTSLSTTCWCFLKFKLHTEINWKEPL